MRYWLKHKAQSISEYVMIIGLVSIVITSVQLYMKRGIQAGIKVAFDQLGNQTYGQLQDHRTVALDTVTTINLTEEKEINNTLSEGEFRTYYPKQKRSQESFSTTKMKLENKYEPPDEWR